MNSTKKKKDQSDESTDSAALEDAPLNSNVAAAGNADADADNGVDTTSDLDNRGPIIQNNMRVYLASKKSFADVCKELGVKQADAFEMAISALRLQISGQGMPGMKDEYDKVRVLLEQVMHSFTTLFDSFKMAKEIAKEEFNQQLITKDVTIASLHERIHGQAAELKELNTSHAATVALVEAMTKELEQLRSSLNDKNMLIESLSNEKAMYGPEVLDSLRTENAELTAARQNLELQVSTLKNEVEQITHQAELNVKEAVLAAREADQTAVTELQNKVNTLYERIAVLTEDNSALKEQIHATGTDDSKATTKAKTTTRSTAKKS